MRREKLSMEEYIKLKDIKVGDILQLGGYQQQESHRADDDRDNKISYDYKLSMREKWRERRLTQEVDTTIQERRQDTNPAHGVKTPMHAQTQFYPDQHQEEKLWVSPGCIIEVVSTSPTSIDFRYVAGDATYSHESYKIESPKKKLSDDNTGETWAFREAMKKRTFTIDDDDLKFRKIEYKIKEPGRRQIMYRNIRQKVGW